MQKAYAIVRNIRGAARTGTASIIVIGGALLLLSGCKTLTPDGGMGLVAEVTATELNKDANAIRTPEQAETVRARVVKLLRRPLSADNAVQIALLNNRGLQAAYNDLGLAEAAMVEAHLPPNPILQIERLSGPLEIEIERRIVANVLALLTLPARARVAADRFHQAQLRAALETLRVAAQTRRAYYRAVASRELAGFLDQSKSAAEAATKLAKRLGETGAMNKLDQAREHVFYAEVTAQLASARQRSGGDREKLIRMLGLWGGDPALKLPAALPALPRWPQSLPDMEIAAMHRRVDLQIARMEVDTLAKSYGLTQATRFVDLLEVTGIRRTTKEKETGEKIRDRGGELELQIPLFDFGGVRVRRAEETYLQAINRLTEKAINVRSEARQAYGGYRSAYDIAGHYEREVLPLRKIISEETLLRYNAMQIDVFDLLAEARQRIAATSSAIEARRDFWLSTTDLLAAIVGGGSGEGGDESSKSIAVAESSAAGH